MKPKHTPCINCGATEYKAIPSGFECEYCGTEYENEFPEWGVVPSPYTTCFSGSLMGGRVYHNESGDAIRFEKTVRLGK